MSKYMLIDSAHLEETRIAIIDGEKLDKFDFETPSKMQMKGNIYLGKIVRVEPSLQAAFVDCGNGKHGFLSFSEIHHDYFQIPISDREELEERIHNAIAAKAEESDTGDGEMDSREISRLRYQFYRRYKIQEVIKKRQIMLVQVTKEERGTKGAALTTYISLAGRYCVLMPNMSKGGGISRKISNPKDREKLKNIVSDLQINNGSTVIRTAGVGHSKTEIKKDFDYLKKIWDEIRDTTLKSTAPCLIYEEANIIKRAIRDLYSRDIESIVVEGEEGYKIAKEFVKKLIPSHSKKVKLYDDKKLPLFSKFKINDQVNQIYSTRVDLPSGGYLIINTTEALVSIDVNSGKSTRERNVGGTALKTNLEAATEIARQCRLRDLAGLIVVDFIDMEDKKNNSQVERCLREELRDDKAKIQIGSISNFGLLEFSRQRLRSSIADANMIMCPHCNGVGAIWSDESIALQILRKIEETCMALELKEVKVTLSTDAALYLLNNKRAFIASIESRGLKITFQIDSTISASDFKISQIVQSSNIESDDNYEQSLESQTKTRQRRKDRPVFNKNKNTEEIASTESIENIPIAAGANLSSKENNHTNPETYTTRSRGRWRQKANYHTNQENALNQINIDGNKALDSQLVDNNTNTSNLVFDNPRKKTTSQKTSEENTDLFIFTPDEPNKKMDKLHNHGTDNRRRRSRYRNNATKHMQKSDSQDDESQEKKENIIIREIDFSKEQNELVKLAETYRDIEQGIGNIVTAATEEITNIDINKPKKTGWWQKLIKKPDNE